MDKDRLVLLLDRYLDGNLTSSELEELSQILLRNSQARKYFWIHVGWNATLREFGERSWGVDLAKNSARAMSLQTNGNPVAKTAVVKSEKSLHGRLLFRLAAVIALTAIIWHFSVLNRAQKNAVATEKANPTEGTSSGVAILTRAVKTVWEKDSLVTKVGSTFAAGKIKLASGLIQLEFSSGATVVLEGPAEFDVLSPIQTTLITGKLWAHVPQSAHGFTVCSKSTNLVDRGTEFGMCVGPEQQTEVHVFNGTVDLLTPGGDETRTGKRALSQGQTARLDATGALTSGESEQRFVNAVEVDQLMAGMIPQQESAWKQHTEKIRLDPRLLCFYEFEGARPWERELHNSSSVENLNGSIVGCQWSEGRRAGKGALDFKRVGDRVRFELPGEYRSFTLMTCVRIDSLEKRLQSLMLSDGYDPGGVHWQITNAGMIVLGIQGPRHLTGVNYISSQLFGPESLGQWVHLAVVVDAEQHVVFHYVDGKVVFSGPIIHTEPLRVRTAQLGNWSDRGSNTRAPIRNFNGRMDEFIAFKAALTPEEIIELSK